MCMRPFSSLEIIGLPSQNEKLVNTMPGVDVAVFHTLIACSTLSHLIVPEVTVRTRTFL